MSAEIAFGFTETPLESTGSSSDRAEAADARPDALKVEELHIAILRREAGAVLAAASRCLGCISPCSCRCEHGESAVCRGHKLEE
jgi:hypothetical protein